MRSRGTVLWLVIGGAIVAALIAGQRVMRPPPRVSVARAQFGAFESWITTNGVIEPSDPRVIRSPVAAFVTAIHVVEGQKVRSGDALVTLDVSPQRAELARAREELIKAQSDVQVLEAGSETGERAQVASELRRTSAEVDQLSRTRDATRRLVAKQAATRDELDQTELALTRAQVTYDALVRRQQDLERTATASLDAARLRVLQARETVNFLDVQVRAADVRAPVEGTVYTLPVRTGNRIEAGAVVAQVADLGALQLRAFVDQPELASIQQGQPVEVSWSAVPNRVWTGRTERVPKSVVSRGERLVGEVICSVKNDSEQLIPNLDVDVRIQLQSRAHALLVPRQAVQGDRSSRYVFVVRDASVERRPIVIEASNPTNYAIQGGLAEGDRVALPLGVELRDGMRVRVEPAVQ